MEAEEVQKTRRLERQLMAQDGNNAQVVDDIRDGNEEDFVSNEDRCLQFHRPNEDYSTLNTSELTDIAEARFFTENLSTKILYVDLLKDDELLHHNNKETYNSGYSTKELRKICMDRRIFEGESPKSVVKSLLIAALEMNDKVKDMQSCQKDLDPIISRHQFEDERLR